MWPRYVRRSYKGKHRYRRGHAAATPKASMLGVRLRVARRKSADYLDRLGEWIEKATSIGSKYKTFKNDWVTGRVGRYIGGGHQERGSGRLIGSKMFIARHKGEPGGREYTQYQDDPNDTKIKRQVVLQPSKIERNTFRLRSYTPEEGYSKIKRVSASTKRKRVREALSGK